LPGYPVLYGVYDRFSENMSTVPLRHWKLLLMWVTFYRTSKRKLCSTENISHMHLTTYTAWCTALDWVTSHLSTDKTVQLSTDLPCQSGLIFLYA